MEPNKTYYSHRSSSYERDVVVLADGSILIEKYGCYHVKKNNVYRGVDYVYDDSKILEAVKEGR